MYGRDMFDFLSMLMLLLQRIRNCSNVAGCSEAWRNMVQSKEDLKHYLECDKKALNITRKHPKLLGDRIWKYEILYRRTEYYYNNRKKSVFHRILSSILLNYYKYRSMKWGNEIPINCIEEGLVIWHGQNIIINPNARIGKNCSISTGVIIGHAHDKYPVVGDNVTLSVDSKVIGGITIADHVVIGAGAVVVKDIDIPYSSWGGVPAQLLRTQIGDLKG